MDEKLITRTYLLSLITSTSFSKRDTVTICTLDVNGLPIRGESHVAFRKDYVQAIGEKVAYENALKQLRAHEVYASRKLLVQANAETVNS